MNAQGKALYPFVPSGPSFAASAGTYARPAQIRDNRACEPHADFLAMA